MSIEAGLDHPPSHPLAFFADDEGMTDQSTLERNRVERFHQKATKTRSPPSPLFPSLATIAERLTPSRQEIVRGIYIYLSLFLLIDYRRFSH